MARSIDAKCRKCRRAMDKLFLKGDRCFSPKCAIVRKAYVPGMHGKKMSHLMSEYGMQLQVKQKIKRTYGILERQFRKHFEDVKGKKGVLGDLLIQRLEMRLDNVVYRLGLGSSRSQSRQLVNHGMICVNGKKVDIPSFEVKLGDVISISLSKKEKEYFKKIDKALKNKKDFPAWLSFDGEKTEGKILGLPGRDDVEMNINPQAVIEYYSR